MKLSERILKRQPLTTVMKSQHASHTKRENQSTQKYPKRKSTLTKKRKIAELRTQKRRAQMLSLMRTAEEDPLMSRMSRVEAKDLSQRSTTRESTHHMPVFTDNVSLTRRKSFNAEESRDIWIEA